VTTVSDGSKRAQEDKATRPHKCVTRFLIPFTHAIGGRVVSPDISPSAGGDSEFQGPIGGRYGQ
jgi:hypothetical protein